VRNITGGDEIKEVVAGYIGAYPAVSLGAVCHAVGRDDDRVQ
jgi:hypothetical protein